MDFLGQVAGMLGAAVNGVMQVIADFINLIISIIPNPDPFGPMIENLSAESAADLGFGTFWLNAFIDVNAACAVLGAWAALMIAAAVFAVVYWIVKAIKP